MDPRHVIRNGTESGRTAADCDNVGDSDDDDVVVVADGDDGGGSGGDAVVDDDDASVAELHLRYFIADMIARFVGRLSAI